MAQIQKMIIPAVNYGTIDMVKVLINYPKLRVYIKENLKCILQNAYRTKNIELIELLS